MQPVPKPDIHDRQRQISPLTSGNMRCRCAPTGQVAREEEHSISLGVPLAPALGSTRFPLMAGPPLPTVDTGRWGAKWGANGDGRPRTLADVYGQRPLKYRTSTDISGRARTLRTCFASRMSWVRFPSAPLKIPAVSDLRHSREGSAGSQTGSHRGRPRALWADLSSPEARLRRPHICACLMIVSALRLFRSVVGSGRWALYVPAASLLGLAF